MCQARRRARVSSRCELSRDRRAAVPRISRQHGGRGGAIVLISFNGAWPLVARTRRGPPGASLDAVVLAQSRRLPRPIESAGLQDAYAHGYDAQTGEFGNLVS